MEAIIYIFVGILLSGLILFLIFKSKIVVDKNKIEEKLKENFVSKELYQRLDKDFLENKNLIEEKNIEIIRLNSMLSAKSQIERNLQEKLENQKKEQEELQNRFKIEFENIANRILEQKSEKFTEQNKKNIDNILSPLKDKLDEFKNKVAETYEKEARERISLGEQVKSLVTANKQISEDANKLANALRIDPKKQGNWGEMQLEILLEKAGLIKDIHYRKQASLDTEESRVQPDIIVNLPEEKHIIIDSKVSLKAFNDYFNADENDTKKAEYLKNHLISVINHIDGLSKKNYQRLHQINSPDYVLMFIANENALSTAFLQDVNLFEKALQKNIVLVSASTLLATLTTVSYIWKQENQKKFVLQIADESGKMYDKFVGFMDDLIDIGNKLQATDKKYKEAMNKLHDGTGNLIDRAEKIKQLGANATKKLDQRLLDRAKVEQENKIEPSKLI